MDSIAGELVIRCGVFAVALLVVCALAARPCLADTFTITWLDDAGETPTHAAVSREDTNGVRWRFAGWGHRTQRTPSRALHAAEVVRFTDAAASCGA